MIIEFSVENFLSFKNLATLSMGTVKSFKEFENTHIIPVDNKLNLLKSAILYGNNASGKSNFLEAIGFMKTTVLNSFRDALIENYERKFPLQKFALNSKSEVESSFFEMLFIHNDKKYRYGFEMDNDRIIAEWLFHTTTKEVPLFRRNFQKIDINKSSFPEGIGKEEDVKENVLFLSFLAMLGKEISTSIIDWFKRIGFINGIHDRGHKRYTIDKLKTDKNFLNWVLHFIKYLEISNLSTTEEDVSEIDLDILKEKERGEEIIDLLASIQKLQSKQPKRDLLVTYHRKYDENNIFIDTIPFNFEEQESEGTKKLMYLLGPWYDSLQNGKILIVDELDSRLHSHLTLQLIDFFHKFNKTNAQLICAAHDISLLNKETFRRDQIWFIEKNQFGISELVSLSDFKKIRNTATYDKSYHEGKFGAIPYFNLDEKLISLLYGKV
jgi:AAA15 family ATPase/GTPase